MKDFELLESAPDAMLIADGEGRVVFANRHAEHLFGYARGELLGQSVDRLVPTRLRSSHKRHRQTFMTAACARPMGGGFDLFACRKDGTEIPVEISLSPLDSQDGTLVVAAVRDVSERKRADQALRDSETRYAALVRGAIHGIYRTTLDGRFLDVNPALIRMLGYSDETELLQLNAAEVYVDATDRDRLIERYRTSHVVPAVETKWKRRDGTPIVVRLSGRILRDSDGAPNAFEMIAEDVTERQLAEERIRTAEKLEAVARLTAGVAHNFNNLLAVLVGSLELIRAQIPPESPAHHDLVTALQAARKASVVVKNMLEFSREADGSPIPVDLNQALEALTPLLNSWAMEKVDIVIDSVAPLPKILIDPVQFEAIIVSLLVNARDAMPHGGTFTIGTGMSPRGGRVRVTATDTGVGIDPAVVSRIFDPFFTTREVGQGVGLGLSAVHGLVKRTGGTITVQSQRDRGATFTIDWPRA
jgi:PAS domain S-box-containing protein